MTLTEIEHAIRQVLNTGQLGNSVSLRIHAAVPDAAGEAAGLVGVFAPLIRLIADDTQGRVQARQHPSGRQISVLWTDDRGRTALVTLTAAPKTMQSLQVMIVGNHGITRLTGGDEWDEPLSPGERPLWKDEIAESVNQGTSIRVEVS